MRNLLLSVALIAVPVAGFAAVETWLMPAPAGQTASAGLGDLAPFAAIVTDTQTIAATGDLAAAQTRITDLETAWDEAEPALRAADANAWGVVDTSIDDALSALRRKTPSPVEVNDTLAALQETLAGPVAAVVTGARTVNGIAVTDETGHALPCEAMLADLAKALDNEIATPEVVDLRAKALERCNADDDARADAFTAQALALLKS